MTEEQKVIVQLRRALFKTGVLTDSARTADAPTAMVREMRTGVYVYTCPLCGQVHHVRHYPILGVHPGACSYAGHPAYKPLVQLVAGEA